MGFAMGLERVYSLMEKDGLLKNLETGIDLYVMPVGENVLNDVFVLTEEVRQLGYSADTPLAALKMGAMFKKAEKRGAKFALILGEDERDKGVAQLKNLKTKEQSEISLEHLADELDSAFHKAFPEEEEEAEGCACGDEHQDGCACESGECHCHDEKEPAEAEKGEKK